MNTTNDALDEFIVAACVPLDSSHASGTIERAETILRAHPDLARTNVYAAAILGDDAIVRRLIQANPADATVKGGPHNWDALTYLCFSKYLRFAPERSEAFVRSALVLLDAGAGPNTGFFSNEHLPKPEFESVLYGAAGVAHHANLTRLLLERGADPNDGEVTYHSPESDDNTVINHLLATGKVTAESLAIMLLRKADWHDYEGIKLLLDHGADPNRLTHWGYTALHQALRRDNALQNIQAMLDRGADPRLATRVEGQSGIVIAARRGRGDALKLFEQRGVSNRLDGFDGLAAACAKHELPEARRLSLDSPGLRQQLKTEGGRLLAEFAGNGNTEGVSLLLELGVDLKAVFEQGDGYFDIAKRSTALHVAAWRARHRTVELLLARGAPVNTLDGKGRSALALAVRACVDSYWQARRAPDSVRALLRAGASVAGIKFPCGYSPVDELLQAHGAVASG